MFWSVWGRAGDRGGLDVQFLPLSWSLQPEGLPMPRGTRRQDTGHDLVCVQDQSKPLCKHLSTPTAPPSQGPERARRQTLQPRERVFGSSLKWGRYQRLMGSKGGSERGDQLGWRWGGGTGTLGPNHSTRGSRSAAGASVQSSCPCSSDIRTSVSSAHLWPRSPAGSLLGMSRGGREGQGQWRGTPWPLTSLDSGV